MISLTIGAQTLPPIDTLDPTRSLLSTKQEAHLPLPEAYIWTAGDAAALKPGSQPAWTDQNARTAVHYFRKAFNLKRVPAHATLFIAGPRSVEVYLNGIAIGATSSDLDSPLGTHVFSFDVQRSLRMGANVLAIAAVRGRGIVQVSVSPLTEQVAYGEVMVAKILENGPNVADGSNIDGPPLLISDSTWRSVPQSVDGWTRASFDDAAWPLVQTLGGIESSTAFFQWNVDAGLYDWPGYQGMSSNLRTFPLHAISVSHIFTGASRFEHLDALTSPSTSDALSPSRVAASFAVSMASPSLPPGHAPGLLLDFGRELNGRIKIDSACHCNSSVLVSYGESETEALRGGDYLGVNLLQVPPHGTARGPKSGFRFAYLHFLGGAPLTAFRNISAEGIYYPVSYLGSFASSDEQINRIWATGAYTTHLCMQDGIWDAVKRDRGEWIGDLDVESRVINDVFADRALIEKTLVDVLGPVPFRDNINNTPSYTAFWISLLAEFYRHTGDDSFLKQQEPALVALLALMNADFDPQGIYLNKIGKWPIVDWAPGLHGINEATREGTAMAFVRGYRDAAYLFRELGKMQQAQDATLHAEQATGALRRLFTSESSAAEDGPFGTRWQLNAMAVLSGVARPGEYPAMWQRSLSSVSQDEPAADLDAMPATQMVSPYYGYYLLQAMAMMGHRQQALDWMRHYWGGMLSLGATSFWETYDPHWPQNSNFHFSLEADGTSGFFVSLAHGWSSGPTAWLMEQVLGVQPLSAGFRTVTIRPDLMDLRWAKGEIPTPRGAIGVSIATHDGTIETTIDLPPGTDADVLIPVISAHEAVIENGVAVPAVFTEEGSRAQVHLSSSGHYSFISR